MKDNVAIVVTPHPDDETLGCGGTLLRLKSKGYKIHWLIITDMKVSYGWSTNKIKVRNEEIKKVSNLYEFDSVIRLGFPTSVLDEIPLKDLVDQISNSFHTVKPNMVFIPFANDAHSDHEIIADATLSCTKWFRTPSINKILYYETLSETDSNFDLSKNQFTPNVYYDISDHLEKKTRIMNVYKSEINSFPFPRSNLAIKSLAHLRGSQSGFDAAEAFQLVKEII